MTFYIIGKQLSRFTS